MNEADFLALLRPLATHPAARGFADDAAVLGDLVITHDMLVEGVHYLPGDPPEDVAWKLLAVNLSDLAAKGASPVGVLMGYTLSGNACWDRAFIAGLGVALAHFAMPLLGGDTVANPSAPRVLSLTAIGRSASAPSRSGALADDALYVTGTIGMAGLGLAELRRDPTCGGANVARYRRPIPRLSDGQTLAPVVHAMMDVSDGLLIDAQRMAAASNLALEISIQTVPVVGDALSAMTAGDDYELLFAAPTGLELPISATRIGTFAPGTGLTLRDSSGRVPLPDRLGWLHQTPAQ
ncbi:thiamine-phosphate kinase [Sphingomonas sp.]|uniref:thiamine-phosphate kinase n=1 Tax=Sphingomonas sp. TaxID=28214 RepID=UPI0025F18561|nr:thiamine-phosphate kinase [Sphingomonas sp.]